jgi:hypothetical protein
MIMRPLRPGRLLALAGAALLLVALASIALVSCGGGAGPGQGTTLSLVHAPASVTASGSAFDVEVRVAGVKNLGAYEWQIRFDPAVVQFVEVVNGPFLGSTGRSVSSLPPILPPTNGLEPGNVRFGCVTSGTERPGPDGGGLLSTVRFQPVADGAPDIQFFCAGLADPLGDDIPLSDVPPCRAAVTPTSGSMPSPTATAMP